MLVNYSTAVKPGERVLIDCSDIPNEFTIELIRAVSEAGGEPFVQTTHPTIQRAILFSATDSQMAKLGEIEKLRMESMQCYIGVRGGNNACEGNDVTKEKRDIWEKHITKPIHFDIRVKKTRWCVLRWPSAAMAQSAGMSTEAFEDFYFKVCAELDYPKMAEAMKPLQALMDRTEQVRIIGVGTDLTFSKKGIPTIPCYGDCNIPDGEMFTAPVRDSVNGTIQFNCQSEYHSHFFNNVRLVFQDGKIVEATAGGDTERLNSILDTDEGARYIGEWSLGFNPFITQPMGDTLFDEKIAGSFHLTPGQAYEEADNGNRSNIHWDMVCLQTEDQGGGEIWFDGVLVRKNGIFVLPELQGLNPDQLGAE